MKVGVAAYTLDKYLWSPTLTFPVPVHAVLCTFDSRYGVAICLIEIASSSEQQSLSTAGAFPLQLVLAGILFIRFRNLLTQTHLQECLRIYTRISLGVQGFTPLVSLSS